MKKIFLSLMLFISVFTFGEQFSNAEKKDILKQAAIFQKAVKNKDINTLANMTQFPLSSQVYGNFELPDEDDTITKEEFLTNKNEVFKAFKMIPLVKLDSAKNKITNYTKKTKTLEEEVLARFNNEDDADYDNDVYGKHFRIVYGSTELDNGEAMMDYGIYYIFKYENKKLKLVRMYTLP